MRVQHQWWSGLVATGLMGLVGVTAGGEQFLPVLSIREGANRFGQIPAANGYIDYLTLLNARDGGINGVPLVWEECETVQDVPRATECYERLKTKGLTGAAAVHPPTAPIAYALTERATHDRIPLLTMDYGRETIPMLDAQAAQYGFVVHHLAVKPPGLDQKATWLRVQVAQPDWVILRVSGVALATALKEAAQVGVPRDKIMGPTATCAEHEMMRAGEVAIGYICASWFGTERNAPLIQEILQYVYTRGQGAGPEEDVGTTRWVWGMLRGLLTAEALRTAMRQFGNQPLTGAQVQWGLEHLSLTPASLKVLGAEGLLAPFSLSCRDHEGGGSVRFQQWDGAQWRVISDWIAPDQALVRPPVEAAAAKYAQEKGITPRDCP